MMRRPARMPRPTRPQMAALSQRIARRANVGGTPAPTTTENVVAANRLGIPTSTYALQDQYFGVREIWFSPEGDVTLPVFTWCGYYFDGLGGTPTYKRTALPAAIQIQALLEFPAGVFTPLTFGGSATGTIPVNGHLQCDPHPSFVGSKGQKAAIYTKNVSGATRTFGATELPANASAIGVIDQWRSTQGTGVLNGTGGADAIFVGPAMMTGTIAKANATSYLICGDSIAVWGTLDTLAGPKGGSGWAQRGLDAYYPYVLVGLKGQAAADIVPASGGVSIADFLALVNVSDAVLAHGRNDINRLAHTSTQLVGDLQAIMALKPSIRYWLATIVPKATSTDGFATLANQTSSNSNGGESITAINTALTAMSGIYRVIDINAYLRSASDPLKWAAPNETNVDGVLTADGTHPGTYGSIRASAAFIDALAQDMAVSTESAAIIAAMTTAPDAVTQRRINATRIAIKNAVTTTFDGFYVHGLHNEQAGRVNWIGTAPTLSVVNAPTFTAGKGFNGNATSSYLESNWTPSANAVNYALNSAHIAVYDLTKVGEAGRGPSADGATSDLTLTPSFGPASNGASMRINDASSSAFASAPVSGPQGWTTATRTGSAARAIRKNGAQLFSDTIASVALPDGPLRIGRGLAADGTQYSAQQWFATCFGGALDLASDRALYQIVGSLRAMQSP